MNTFSADSSDMAAVCCVALGRKEESVVVEVAESQLSLLSETTQVLPVCAHAR